MIRNGARPIKHDHRDYSFHKSFGTVGFNTQTLPADFNVDAGLTMPNQNEPNATFGIGPLFYGCTGYTQTELCTDEDGVLYNPKYTYDKTLAKYGVFDESRGADIRDSLSSIINDGVEKLDKTVGSKRTYYFNVKPQGREIDWFDAIRIAIWLTQAEKRSVSIGTPWYGEWTAVGYGNIVTKTADGFSTNIGGVKTGIMPAPFDWKNIGAWHNYKISGWKTINGIPYLLAKTWQGKDWGDEGWAYFPREVVNVVMAIRGCGAFTSTKLPVPDLLPIDSSVFEKFVSFIRNLFNL